MLREKKIDYIVCKNGGLLISSLLDGKLKHKFSIVLRNPIKSKRLEEKIVAAIASDVSVVSFDYSDCQDFILIYHPQFIERLARAPNQKIEYDFVFIGRDKGRASVLHEIQKKINKMDFSNHFIILDKESQTSGGAFIC